MNITSTRNRPSIQPRTAQPQPEATQGSNQQEPRETYSAWDPIKNAGVVGAAIGVPAAIGAVTSSLFPNAGPLAKGAMVLGSATALGLGAGLWAIKGAKEEFNGHPILTGISGFVAGGAGLVGGALLSPVGVSYGWTGVAVAAGVGAIGAGVVSAIGIHASQKGDG